MIGIYSLIACGPPCWEAKDDLCRCSCGGKNHGVHRHKRPGAENLRRQMVYGGFIFELSYVAAPQDRGSGMFGPEILDRRAQDLNQAAGIRHMFAHTSRNHYGEFPVAIVRPVTEAQIAKWPELAAWRGKVNGLYGRPSILWTRRDDLTQQVAANLKAS